MKKFVFTFTALVFFSSGVYAFNYDSRCPSNQFRGTPLVNPAPTLNGSPQAYQDMVNANYYSKRNRINVNHRYYNGDSNNVSPRKVRKHGSAANKRRH